MDAGDVQGTDATDVQMEDTQPDVQMEDTQPDVQMEDTQPDVQEACMGTGTIDPSNYWVFRDSVYMVQIDGSALGMGNGLLPLAKINGRTAMPTTTAGDCVQYATFSGSPERDMAPDFNLGTITVSQGSRVARYEWNPAMMQYGGDGSMAVGLVFNMPVTAMIPGGPGGEGGMATLEMTPILTASMIPMMPTTVSRSMGNVVMLPNLPDAQPDAASVIFLSDGTNFSNTTICAVPACRRSITIPPAITTNFSAGQSLIFSIGVMRATPIMAGTRSINYTIGSFVQYSATAVD